MNNVTTIFPIERRIVQVAVGDILQAGYRIGVYRLTGYEVEATNDAAVVLTAAQRRTACDLHVFEQTDAGGGWKRIGFVKLTFGNEGWNVIEDHSISLAPALTNADALAKHLKNSGIEG